MNMQPEAMRHQRRIAVDNNSHMAPGMFLGERAKRGRRTGAAANWGPGKECEQQETKVCAPQHARNSLGVAGLPGLGEGGLRWSDVKFRLASGGT